MSTGTATAAASCMTACSARSSTDIKAEKSDHLAVTGDLVNLALDGEIELARLWLETLGPAGGCLRRSRQSRRLCAGRLRQGLPLVGAWMRGDGYDAPAGRHAFPYLRVRGQVALIGVSTARATAPFMANGFFRDEQAARLGRCSTRRAGTACSG